MDLSTLTDVASEYNCMSAVPRGSSFTVLCPAVEEFMLDHLLSFDVLSSKDLMLASGAHVTFDIVWIRFCGGRSKAFQIELIGSRIRR